MPEVNVNCRHNHTLQNRLKYFTLYDLDINSTSFILQICRLEIMPKCFQKHFPNIQKCNWKEEAAVCCIKSKNSAQYFWKCFLFYTLAWATKVKTTPDISKYMQICCANMNDASLYLILIIGQASRKTVSNGERSILASLRFDKLLQNTGTENKFRK